MENGRFVFWAPLWDSGTTYHVHLRFIGKRVVDFLLNFFASCYRWGSASAYRLKISDFAPTGSAWPKN